MLPTGNVLATVVNTHPDFYWLVGVVESLLLKVWNPCTVTTYSRELRLLCESYGVKTCDSLDHVRFQVHDFGYRGCSSEETAALAGSAHLLNFGGSDTLPAVKFVRDWYGPQKNTFIAGSVPATEHSVMCSYGRDQEFQAFERLLDQYPSGSLSTLGKIQNETSHFRLGFRSEIPNFHPLTFSRFHLSNLSVWRH